MSFTGGTVDDHGCAVLADGSVRCWGNNSCGQLGVDPGPDGNCPPIDMPDAGADAGVDASDAGAPDDAAAGD